MKQWWIFKGRSNFYSELVLDDECEKEVRARPEGFYDVVSENDTVEGGIHVVEYAEYEKLAKEIEALKAEVENVRADRAVFRDALDSPASAFDVSQKLKNCDMFLMICRLTGRTED